MINVQANKCANIKTVIELLSGVNDIGAISRKRPIPDLKKIYCKVCSLKTNAPYEVIASELNGQYTHSSVSINIKEFDQLSERKQFPLFDLFEDVLYTLDERTKIIQSPFHSAVVFNEFLKWYYVESKKTPEETDLNHYFNKYISNNQFN